jgi:hypothetical protein
MPRRGAMNCPLPPYRPSASRDRLQQAERREARVLTATLKPGDNTAFRMHRFPVTVLGRRLHAGEGRKDAGRNVHIR